MIDLTLSDDSRQFQELTRDFAQKEMAPLAQRFDQTAEFPSTIFEQASEMGLMNVLIPEEFGGLGLSLTDACVILEELAAACPAMALTVAANLMSVSSILVSGNKQLLQRMAGVLSEKVFAGVSLSLAQYSVTGDGYYISGEKLTVLNGKHAGAIVVPAVDSSNSRKTLFLLNPADLQTVGSFPRFGLKCSDIAVMDIGRLAVKADAVIGEEGRGAELMEQAQVLRLVMIASCATAIIRAALEHSVRYSKERHAFSQPIANFQAVAFMMADMARAHQAARLLTWRAASLWDAGVRERLSALSACEYALESAMKSATDAVQIFGGYGYSKEYPVEKLMRDAKLLQMLQSDTFESRLALGREFLGVH